MNRRSTAAVGALVAAAAAVAAWALAYPDGSAGQTGIRVVADCAAVLTLGLAAVPLLDATRHRDELIATTRVPLAAASAMWLLAELARLLLAAAQAAAVPFWRLDMRTATEFATATGPGRAAVLAVVVAAAVAGAALAAPATTAVTVALTGAAAAGVVARQLTGHFSASTVGGLAVAMHTLAAALWCGVLAGLVLTVEHRGQWARLLPRFSQLALGCVVVLLVGGLIGALDRVDFQSGVFATGYGRLLAAKSAMTVVLVVLGWRNRTVWVPAARSHRTSAVVSRTRSRVETGLMIVVLALAAGLAVTG
ncbi:copper resistance D family protein [Mycolicibacterium phlei]